MMDGADAQVDGFQDSKGAFRWGERLVATHTVWRGQVCGGQRRADDIDAVERGFGGDFVEDAAEGESGVGDVEREVLGDFVLVDDFTDGQGDPVLAGEAAGRDPGPDLHEVGPGGVEVAGPVWVAQPGRVA